MNIIVMGVSGCGKSTFAKALADAIEAEFVEGDELHSEENVAKMISGLPLEDEDRQGWLARIRDLLKLEPSGGLAHRVVTCSALKKKYRGLLRGGDSDLVVVYLTVPKEVLEARMKAREHFMPPSLLVSQLRDLEVPRRAIEVSAMVPVEEMVRSARLKLGL